jgi:hypothetical protein
VGSERSPDGTAGAEAKPRAEDGTRGAEAKERAEEGEDAAPPHGSGGINPRNTPAAARAERDTAADVRDDVVDNDDDEEKEATLDDDEAPRRRIIIRAGAAEAGQCMAASKNIFIVETWERKVWTGRSTSGGGGKMRRPGQFFIFVSCLAMARPGGASTGAVLAIERLRHAVLVADRRDNLAELKVRTLSPQQQIHTRVEHRLTTRARLFPPLPSRSASFPRAGRR